MSEQASAQISSENNDYDICDDSVADVTSDHHQMVHLNMNTSKTPTIGKQFLFLYHVQILY